MRLATRRSGFSLVEMMVGISCGLFCLASVLVAGSSLQRSFMAVESYSTAEGDQLRVQDYIALDCRRATAVSIVACDGTKCPTGTNMLTLTVPGYYDNSGNVVNPSYTAAGTIQYSAAPVTINYYQSLIGASFMREVAGSAKAIATNVDTFTVNPQDVTSSVTCSITFAPHFMTKAGADSVNGTTVYANTFLRNGNARQ